MGYDWKRLVAAHFKAHRRVDFEWCKGHSSSNPHNKKVDKLAKASAKGPLRSALAPVGVRRKRAGNTTEIGSIRAEGQRLNIRVIQHEYLPEQRMYKYRFEVTGRGNPYFGKVDWIFAERDVMLSAGHEYHVRLNNDADAPRIVQVYRKLARRPLKSA